MSYICVLKNHCFEYVCVNVSLKLRLKAISVGVSNMCQQKMDWKQELWDLTFNLSVTLPKCESSSAPTDSTFPPFPPQESQ